MKPPEECLEMLAAAYHCPDVAMTETIALIQLDAFREGMTRSAHAVKQLAACLVGNEKSDGTRDGMVYEQGIGCEKAGKMLDVMIGTIHLGDIK